MIISIILPGFEPQSLNNIAATNRWTVMHHRQDSQRAVLDGISNSISGARHMGGVYADVEAGILNNAKQNLALYMATKGKKKPKPKLVFEGNGKQFVRYHCSRKRLLDSTNLEGSIKHIEDALVYAGLLAGDSNTYIERKVTQAKCNSNLPCVTIEIWPRLPGDLLKSILANQAKLVIEYSPQDGYHGTVKGHGVLPVSASSDNYEELMIRLARNIYAR